MTTHRATIFDQNNLGAVSVIDRKTPEPASNEVLIKVKTMAMNPVDYYQRDQNYPPVHHSPAVLGCDVGGTIVKIGKDVPSNMFTKGARVSAFASSFFHPDPNDSADHGGFQELTVAQWQYVINVPDHVSFQEAAVFPLATLTALSGWTTMDIPLSTKYAKEDKQAILLWGAASSVGTIAVQKAKSMGYHIYATASPRNHAYIQSLGADRMFDYSSPNVVQEIADAVKQDGVHLTLANCIVDNSLEPSLAVLEKVNEKGKEIKVIHTPVLPPDHPTIEGAIIKFNMPSTDKEIRDQTMAEIYHDWLEKGLHNKTIVPSPRVHLQPGGIEAVDSALTTLKNGISCAKVVVELP